MLKTRVNCEYPGCEKSYCSLFNLKRHIESSHMGVKKFKCPICMRFLSSKQNYIDHQNIHTSAKPYNCGHPGCSLTFRQLSQYYIHQKLHLNSFSESPDNDKIKSNSILTLLSSELTKVSPSNYTIPLLPYSVDSIHLPQVLQCSSETQHSIQLPKLQYSPEN